jgi:uncharacterized protein (TIGR03435 family)
MKLTRISLVLAAIAGLLGAQTFDVASIRLNTSGAEKAGIESRRGNFSVENLSLRNLILLAYGLRDFQLAGGPSWIESERYDVRAKTDNDVTVGFAQGSPMVQALLRDRFGLRVHRETRQGAVYFLTVAQGGLKMARTKDGSCRNLDVNHMPPPGEPERVNCGTGSGPNGGGRMNISGITIADVAGSPFPSLISRLAQVLGRAVIDRTGLNGNFELHLEWSDTDGPSLFTAMQEQMGLKLESGRGPFEVLVIDHVERPTEN